jgi:hypothetical protein
MAKPIVLRRPDLAQARAGWHEVMGFAALNPSYSLHDAHAGADGRLRTVLLPLPFLSHHSHQTLRYGV